MDSMTKIAFKVTSEQKKTIDARLVENGFDDISAYLKMVALKTQPFTLSALGDTTQTVSIELFFCVSELEKSQIEENMKKSNCEDLSIYLRYVALHAVVSAVVEVRSTGGLDDMLARITKQKSR